MAARRINPNHITTIGTLCSMIAGGVFASGHISMAGWFLGLTALFDVVDGQVARLTGRTTVFGAFYDSTLDRVADGAVLGGIAIFFARNGVHHKIPDYMSTPMVAVLLLGIIGSFLTSYTRARAEGLGIDAKVGILQRPERIVLIAAPQAFFGLRFHGWMLIGICVVLALTAWITAIQRIAFVWRATLEPPRVPKAAVEEQVDILHAGPAGDTRAQPDQAARRAGETTPAPQLDAAR